MGKFSISLENQRNPDKDAISSIPPRRTINFNVWNLSNLTKKGHITYSDESLTEQKTTEIVFDSFPS